MNREVLFSHLEKAVGGHVHLAAGGPIVARRIGLVTGGAGSEVAKAAAAGIDTFITGEGPHWSYPAAEELGINLFYAGHYATETFGVKALAKNLSEKFALPWQFIDHPRRPDRNFSLSGLNCFRPSLFGQTDFGWCRSRLGLACASAEAQSQCGDSCH